MHLLTVVHVLHHQPTLQALHHRRVLCLQRQRRLCMLLGRRDRLAAHEAVAAQHHDDAADAREELRQRDFAIEVAGITVGTAVGVLTGGAGFAIEAGLCIVAGVASDVVTGADGEASGKTPTWQSVGTDALYRAIGGVAVEGIGKVKVSI